MYKKTVAYILLSAIFLLILTSCGSVKTSNQVNSVRNGEINTFTDGHSNGTTSNVVVATDISLITTAVIEKDSVPIDYFSSIAQMTGKAGNYKTVNDIFTSANADPNLNYYAKFTEDKLTMIFKDKFVQYPKLNKEYAFISGGLSALGYYYIVVNDATKTYTLYEYTYKSPSEVEKAKKSVKFTYNGIKYYSDGTYIYWQQNGFWIKLEGDIINLADVKKFVSSVTFAKENLK